MRVSHAVAIVAGLAMALVAGCTAPQTPPAQTPTPDAPSSPGLSSPTFATFDPPSQFDLTHAVRLTQADSLTQGTLDGFDFFTMDSTATLLGIDVRDGSTVLDTRLDGGGATGWACWQQAVTADSVYTIAANYQGDPTVPVPVQITAVNRATGAIAWVYRPPTDVLPAATGCDTLLSYTITVTKYGLLLSLGQDENPQVSYSQMLDLATGAVRWQADSAVNATDQTDYGIVVTMALVPTPCGITLYQVSPVDLATGEVGDPLFSVRSADGGGSMQLAERWQLAGQAGDNLILIADSYSGPGAPGCVPPTTAPPDTTLPSDAETPTDTATDALVTTTRFFQVSATSGEGSTDVAIQAAATDLANCQVATSDRLVCTTTDNPTTAVGVSLADGSTVWQHAYTTDPGPDSPLLFHGYLYGFDERNNVAYVLDASDGSVQQSGAYPRAIAVDETGLVFTVTDASGDTAWQCWWAPALA